MRPSSAQGLSNARGCSCSDEVPILRIGMVRRHRPPEDLTRKGDIRSSDRVGTRVGTQSTFTSNSSSDYAALCCNGLPCCPQDGLGQPTMHAYDGYFMIQLSLFAGPPRCWPLANTLVNPIAPFRMFLYELHALCGQHHGAGVLLWSLGSFWGCKASATHILYVCTRCFGD